VAVADPGSAAAAEFSPVLRDTARVAEAICQPEHTYVSSQAHGAEARRHLHFEVQPASRCMPVRACKPPSPRNSPCPDSC
jgi:hypothetical protein